MINRRNRPNGFYWGRGEAVAFMFAIMITAPFFTVLACWWLGWVGIFVYPVIVAYNYWSIDRERERWFRLREETGLR